MAAPRRVFGYCRVSSAGQEKSGTSLEGQRDEITRWCAAQGYPAPTLAVEVESGSAEKIERRVEQVRLTAEAQSGDVVVVVAVDRWSRDIVHAVSSVRARRTSLASRRNVASPSRFGRLVREDA